MAGGKQHRGRSDPEGAVLASSKSVAPTVSSKSCHANDLKQRGGGRPRTPARDKQDAGRGRGRSKSRTRTPPARPAQGKSDGAAPISSITVRKGDEDEVSKIGDASAMATRPVSRPKNMNIPGPSRRRSKSREHTRGKSKERGLSKEEKHEQKKRDISHKLKSLEIQSSNKKSLAHKNTEAKPHTRGRRPAYGGSKFDCDGMCMVHPRIKLAKKKGDGWKEIHSKCPACSLNESSESLGLQTDRTARRERDSPKKTTERTTSEEGDEQAYIESANNFCDEGQNARKSRGRMGGFSRPRAFSRGRGKIGAEEQGGNSIARKFSRARSKSRTRRKTETSIGESKVEGEQGSEKKSRMIRVRSISRSRGRADSTVSSGDNDYKIHSLSGAMAKGVKRLGSKGFGLLKKDSTVQSELDIPNKELPRKNSMAANSVPSGAASAASRRSFDSGRFDEYTAALSDSGRDAYNEPRKRSLDRSRGYRSLSPPPAAETRLVVRDDSTYMTFDGTIRSADSRSYLGDRRRRSFSASPPRTGMRRMRRDHSFDSYSRRSGPFDDSSRRSGSSYSRRGDSISPPRNRSPLHRDQSNNRSRNRGPDYLRRGTPPNDSGRQQRYNRRQSGGERRNSFSSRGPGIPPARSSNRRGIRRNSFRSRSPSPFGSDAGSFRSRRGRSYSRSPSPYEMRSSYSESSYQGSPRQRYSRHNSLTGSRHQFSRQNSLSGSFRSQEGPPRRNSGPRQSYNRRSSIGRSFSPPKRRGGAGRSYSPPPRRRNSLHDSYNSSSSRDSRYSRSPPPIRGEPRHSRRNSLSPGQRRGGQRRGPWSTRIQERSGPVGGLRRPSSPIRSWSPAANRRPSMHVARRRSSNGRPLSNGRQLSNGRPMSRGRRPSSNCRPSFDGPPSSRGRRPGSDGRPSFDGPPSSRGRRPMSNGRPKLNDRSTSRGRRPMSNGRPMSRGRRSLSRPRPGPVGDESFALVVRRNSLSRSPDPVRSSISPGPRPVAPPPDPNEPEIWIACVHQEDDPFENSFATFEEFSVAAGTMNGRHGTIDRMGSQRSIERMPPPQLSPQSRGDSLSPGQSSFRDRDRSVSPRSLNSLDEIPSNRKSASFHTSQRQKWSEFNEQTRPRANNLTALTQSLNIMSAAGSGRVGVRSKPPGSSNSRSTFAKIDDVSMENSLLDQQSREQRLMGQRSKLPGSSNSRSTFAKIDDESMGNSLLDQQSREQRLMGQHNNRPRQHSFHGSEPRGGNLDRSDGSSLHTRRADRSQSHIDMKNVEAALRNIKALQLEYRVTEMSDSENHVSVSRRSSAGSGAAPGWANERPTNLHPATTQTPSHQQYSDDQLQRRNSQNIHQSNQLANSPGYREENSFGERRNSLSDRQSPRAIRYHHVADDKSATSLDDYNTRSRSFEDDRSNSHDNERNIERSLYDDRSNATGNRGSSIGGSSRHSAGRSSSRRSERSFRDDQSNLSGNRSNFTGMGSGYSDVAQFTDIRSNPPPPPPLPHPRSHGSPPASSDYENSVQENNLQEYHQQAQQNHTDQYRNRNQHPAMNQSPGNAGNDNWRQFQVSDSPVEEVRNKGASENQFNDWRKYMVGSDRQKERVASRKGRGSDERNIIQVKQMPFSDRFGDFGYYSGLVNEKGRPDGKGSMKYENGVFYEGMWADGSQDKDAVSQYSRIRGGFSSWSGKGKQASKSGAVLPWNARRNDAHDPSGKTNVRGMEWTDLNGDSGRYTGEVNNDQLPHGKGIMKYGFGLIAEGDWINGVLKEGPQDRLVAGTSMGSGPQSVMGSVMGRNMNMSVGPMSVGPMSVDQSTFSRARSIGASSFGMRSIPGMSNPMAMSQPGNAQQHAIISQQNAMMRQQMGPGLPMQAAPMMMPQQMMPQQMMPQQMMPQQMMPQQMMPQQMMPQQMMQHQMMPVQMSQMQPQMQMGRLPMQAQFPPGQGGGGQIPRVASQGSIGKPPITEINIK